MLGEHRRLTLGGEVNTNIWMPTARSGATVVLLNAVAASAYGGSPWDGLWDLDRANSRLSAHTFSLTKLPDGMWRYGDGPSASVFAIDGKPYSEPNAPDFTMTARISPKGVLELIESGYGRDMQRDRWEPSKDGAALTVTSTRIYPDGREVTNTSSAVRVAGTSGFAGIWKEVPEDNAHDVPTDGNPEQRAQVSRRQPAVLGDLDGAGRSHDLVHPGDGRAHSC
jgi:hypothetical protein